MNVSGGTIGQPNTTEVSTLTTEQVIRWAAVILSLIVGIATALKELYHNGNIWRDKRAAGGDLKMRGWRYFQFVGIDKDRTYKQAYANFASTVEDITEHEIKDYFLITHPQKDPTNTGVGNPDQKFDNDK